MEDRAMRKSGIEAVGDVPWGTHICQFYETKQDLLEILMPFFEAGLENNEFCMWITPSFYSKEEAEHAMREEIPSFDKYLERNQIEVVPQTEWYMKDGVFNLQNFLDKWVTKLESVLIKRFTVFRASMNAAWLGEDNWRAIADYEEKDNNIIERYHMIAICTYPLGWYRASETLEVISSHQHTLSKRNGKWEETESQDARKAKRSLNLVEKSLETLLETSMEGIAVADTRLKLTYVNNSFAEMLGYNKDELEGMYLRKLTDKEGYKKT